MRTHQKYFAVKDPKTGALAPNFIVVANQAAPEGGKEIAKGNSKVLSARLADAQFFQKEDAKKKLIDYYDKLDTVVFHKKLGSIRDKAERVTALARELALKVGADDEISARAAKLAKCDLVTQTVIEFTSLQGQIGSLMYKVERGDRDIANAIEEHYKPQGPKDSVPTSPVSITVALADKIDTLVGFWSINEKPTGSKDPYALRRAALGVIRIILENGVRIKLENLFDDHSDLVASFRAQLMGTGTLSHGILDLVYEFIPDRLKVYLRDKGIRHDIIDAAFAKGEDDLVAIVNRVEALQSFLETSEGENLLAGYKRAANILKAEAKKGDLPEGAPDKPAEKESLALYTALQTVGPKIETALKGEKYTDAMSQLATLRGPIDAFFTHVQVISDDTAVKTNNLRLLLHIRDTARQIADFDRISG